MNSFLSSSNSKSVIHLKMFFYCVVIFSGILSFTYANDIRDECIASGRAMVEIKIMTNNLKTDTYDMKNVEDYWSFVKLNSYVDEKLYRLDVQPSSFSLYKLSSYVYSVEIKTNDDGKIEIPDFDLKICDQKIIQSVNHAYFQVLRPISEGEDNSKVSTQCNFIPVMDWYRAGPYKVPTKNDVNDADDVLVPDAIDNDSDLLPTLQSPNFLALTVVSNIETSGSFVTGALTTVVARAQGVNPKDVQFVDYRQLDHNSGVITTMTYLPPLRSRVDVILYDNLAVLKLKKAVRSGLFNQYLLESGNPAFVHASVAYCEFLYQVPPELRYLRSENRVYVNAISSFELLRSQSSLGFLVVVLSGFMFCVLMLWILSRRYIAVSSAKQ